MKIAISGPYRAGKTTLADKLAEYLGCKSFALADSLKRLAVLQGLPPSEVYAETKTPATRKAFGDISDKLPKNYFIEQLHRHSQGKPYVVLGDLRLRHELEYCQSMGYLIVFIGEPDGKYALNNIYQAAHVRLPHRPDVNPAELLTTLANMPIN